MNGETLYYETAYLRAFPAASEVFANRVEEHSEFLLPVATLSLKYLRQEWDGSIPIVMPIEPVGGDGEPGDKSRPYHNYLCRPNWIGYRLLDDKCEVACDFRFFHKAYYAAHPPRKKSAIEAVEELASHYTETRDEFERHAIFFRQHGWLAQRPELWSGLEDENDRRPASLVLDLGGTSFGGNWSSSDDFPLSKYPDQFEDRGKIYKCDRVLPRTEDGRDFHYIGQVEMWNFIGDTNGILVVFYDPVERIVLTTFDWT